MLHMFDYYERMNKREYRNFIVQIEILLLALIPALDIYFGIGYE